MTAVEYNQRYNDVSGDIGYNVQFSNAAIAISDNLDLIASENENIQSGNTTPLQNMPEIISDTLHQVDFCLKSFLTTFLTEEQQSGYFDGDCFLDEIVGIDLLNFYNALQRVKIYIQSINGTLRSIPRVDDIRFSSATNEYILTEEEFDEDSRVVQNTSNYTYYEVMDGDTARIVALRELNDQESFTKILQLNDITESDFINGNLVGKQIKIPTQTESASRSADNLVYEGDTTNLESFLFGSDISTKDGKLKISQTGDLLRNVGIENAYENIENKVKSKKGSLNVFNPNFGSVAVDDGNAPLLVKIDRYITDQVNQIQRDPRVESVEVNLDRMEYDGTSLRVPTKVFFLGVSEGREVLING